MKSGKKFEFFAQLFISACIVLVPPVIMAWRSHGTNNEELVSKLRANEVVKSDKVERVMKSVDRGDFCKSSPYSDSPQGIGKTHALLAEINITSTFDTNRNYLGWGFGWA